MPVATLNGKGRITLPLSVRNALGVDAGAQLAFVPVDGGFLMSPVRNEASSLKGRFAGRVKKPLSVDAMDDAIASGAAAAIRRTPLQRK